jgi:hypothetical protein
MKPHWSRATLAPSQSVLRLGADQDEQPAGRDGPPGAGPPVLQHQRLQLVGAAPVDHLRAVQHADIRRGIYLAMR